MVGVDVVIPCYQYGRYLRDCVTSVLSQGIDQVRVLIIDNASTDNSVEVARQLASEDNRVQVVANQRNVGATASFNAGIEWASAEYFVELDADDLLAPGCLKRALSAMQAHPNISFTYGIEAFVLPDGSMQVHSGHSEAAAWKIQSGREFIAEICRLPKNYVGAPTVVRRTSAQKLAGYYRPELPYTDDLEMWLRLASVGDVANISRMQGIRRIHELQMSSDYRNRMVRDFTEREAAFKSFFANEGRSVRGADKLLEQAVDSLAEHAYWSAVSHFLRGYFRDSGQLFKFCLSRRPGAAIFPPIGWLLRTDRPFSRAEQVLRDAVRRRRASGNRRGAT